jgi:hypothetical protein
MSQQFKKGLKIKILDKEKYKEHLDTFIIESWTDKGIPDYFIITGFKEGDTDPYYTVVNTHSDKTTTQGTISKELLSTCIEEDIVQNTQETMKSF